MTRLALLLLFILALGAGFFPLSSAQASEDDVTLEEAAILDEELEARGGDSIQTSDQDLLGTVTGNTVNVTGDFATGAVNVGDFGSGIGSYVINTGANANVNSAVSINIQMLPSP